MSPSADEALPTPPVMTPSVDDVAANLVAPPMLNDRLAKPMFWLGFLYLLLVAGLIHRYGRDDVTQIERRILLNGVMVLWIVFQLEAICRIVHRNRVTSRLKELGRWLLVTVFPPFRMGFPSISRAQQIWLPFIGWQTINPQLTKRLDRAFSVPMLLFAFLILPILILEYTWEAQIKENPYLSFVLHVSIALIWVAFALEFILKVSTAKKTLGYLKDRWLDAAIVIIPALEFVLTNWVEAAPLARLFRLSRALQPQQLSRLSRLYRLRGLIMRAWHAILLLEVVTRIFGFSPEKRLKQLEEHHAVKMEELAELVEQIEGVKKLIADRDAAAAQGSV